jgi:hypothetical protein
MQRIHRAQSRLKAFKLGRRPIRVRPIYRAQSAVKVLKLRPYPRQLPSSTEALNQHGEPDAGSNQFADFSNHDSCVVRHSEQLSFL